MAVSIIYLDDHGKQVAERISDITYRSEDIADRKEQNNYFPKNSFNINLLFVCGSDKTQNDVKFNKDENYIPFFVKIREFKSLRQYGEHYPELNTIYISPEENDLTEDEYYSLCYQRAENIIREFAAFASDDDDRYIALDQTDIKMITTNAFFVDAFTIEKPDISHFDDAVNELSERCNTILNGSNDAKALIHIRAPEDLCLADYNAAMDALSKFDIRSKVELGFNKNGESSISITAAIFCCDPECEAK